MKAIQEKRIFLAYEFGLLLKAIQALLEIIAGGLFYFLGTHTIVNFVLKIMHTELTETPRDFLFNIMLSGVNQLSISGKSFITFYLLSHGVIKLIIIIGLFLKRSWAYPAAVIGFGGLILYEIYNLVIGYSLSLLIFILMDIIIFWLIVREHKVPKRYTNF